jgi:hypothetical protein
MNIIIMQGLVIKPGDKVLLALNVDWTEEETKEAKEELIKRFPDAEFTFVAGVTGIMSLPTEVAEVLSTSEVVDEPKKEPEEDERPHSRACGFHPHPHGMQCSKDCPTCGGRAKREMKMMGTWEEDLGVEDMPYRGRDL